MGWGREASFHFLKREIHLYPVLQGLRETAEETVSKPVTGEALLSLLVSSNQKQLSEQKPICYTLFLKGSEKDLQNTPFLLSGRFYICFWV